MLSLLGQTVMVGSAEPPAQGSGGEQTPALTLRQRCCLRPASVLEGWAGCQRAAGRSSNCDTWCPTWLLYNQQARSAKHLLYQCCSDGAWLYTPNPTVPLQPVLYGRTAPCPFHALTQPHVPQNSCAHHHARPPFLPWPCWPPFRPAPAAPAPRPPCGPRAGPAAPGAATPPSSSSRDAAREPPAAAPAAPPP